VKTGGHKKKLLWKEKENLTGPYLGGGVFRSTTGENKGGGPISSNLVKRRKGYSRCTESTLTIFRPTHGKWTPARIKGESRGHREGGMKSQNWRKLYVACRSTNDRDIFSRASPQEGDQDHKKKRGTTIFGEAYQAGRWRKNPCVHRDRYAFSPKNINVSLKKKGKRENGGQTRVKKVVEAQNVGTTKTSIWEGEKEG